MQLIDIILTATVSASLLMFAIAFATGLYKHWLDYLATETAPVVTESAEEIYLICEEPEEEQQPVITLLTPDKPEIKAEILTSQERFDRAIRERFPNKVDQLRAAIASDDRVLIKETARMIKDEHRGDFGSHPALNSSKTVLKSYIRGYLPKYA